MINNIVMKQPTDVIDKCRVTENSVFIPSTLFRSEIKGDIADALKEEGPNLEKALYATVEIPKPRLKSLDTLLSGKGR